MLINALVEIGKSLEGEVENTQYDSEIVKFIDMRYSNPPKMDKIIKINIKPCILKSFQLLKEKIKQFDLNEYNLKKYINKKLNKKERQEVVEQIIEIIKPNLEDFKKCMDTQLVEYKPKNAYQMLRGEKSGAAVFLSPTMFAKISSKKITEFPLWKINLELNIVEEQKKNDETELFMREFFQNLPNMQENSKLSENDPELIFKFIISEIFSRVLNSYIENYNLKTGFYFFPICFYGKWSYEFELIREYYKKKIGESGKAHDGICEGCGEIKKIDDGLTKELGFFSTDQKSFEYSFFQTPRYQLCNECKFYAEKGFNYVKKNLRVYLGNRGKDKSPFEIYIIPIAENLENLSNILPTINFNRTISGKDKKLKQIKKAGEVAKEAKESIQKFTSDKEEKIADNSEGDQGRKDFVNFLLNLGSEGSKRSQPRFELLLITFYHPEGQSSNFHNIVSIELMDYKKIIRVAKALVNLDKRGNTIYLADIYHIFGIH